MHLLVVDRMTTFLPWTSHAVDTLVFIFLLIISILYIFYCTWTWIDLEHFLILYIYIKHSLYWSYVFAAWIILWMLCLYRFCQMVFSLCSIFLCVCLWLCVIEVSIKQREMLVRMYLRVILWILCLCRFCVI